MGDHYTRLYAALDGIVETVREAKAMPLSASCMVHRGELLAALDQLRALLPRDVGDADRIVAAGQLEAERVVAGAHGERARLLADTDSGRSAEDAAARIVAEAQETAYELRRDIDAYVDTKLANFEVVLGRALDSVARGRAKLAGRTDFAALVTDDLVGEDLVGHEPVGGEPVGGEPAGGEPVHEEPVGEAGAADGPHPAGTDRTPALREPYEEPVSDGAGSDEPVSVGGPVPAPVPPAEDSDGPHGPPATPREPGHVVVDLPPVAATAVAVDPEPVDPEPVDVDPTDPEPTEPEPVEPEPIAEPEPGRH